VSTEALHVVIQDTLPDDAVAWDALAASTGRASTFLRHEWLRTWLQCMRPRGKPWIACIRRSREVIGWVPLMRSRMVLRGLPLLRVVRFIGAIETTYRDVVCRPEDLPDCVSALCRFLAQHRREWDVAELTNIPQTSPTAAHLARALENERLATAREDGIACLYIALPKTYEQWEDGLGAKTRSNIRYYRKKLEGDGHTVAFEETRDAARSREAFSQLAELHQRRWEQRGESGVFGDPSRRAFYEESIAALAARGEMWFFQVSVDGTPAACAMRFVQGKRLHAFLQGWEPAWGSYRVMTALFAHTVRRAIEEGFEEYDLSIGDYDYKHYFTSLQRNNQTVVAAAAPWKLALWQRIERAARWVRP
jgi:CelD/BcsL family acetyltransferase involved in cellulose biosynthesis